MNEWLRLIEKYRDISDCVLVLGIDGAYAGQKAFYADEKLLWQSEKANVFAQMLNGAKDEILSIKTNGLLSNENGRVFVERFGMRSRMIVCGAGTVGCEVLLLGKQLGYYMVALEDRKEFADKAKSLGADEVLCMDFVDGLRQLKERTTDYFIVMTREHCFDQVCLETILNRKFAYVGMMASKKRAAILKDALLEKGYSKELIEKLHSPIGLSIHAETPAEIAVSIFSEIIMERNSVKGSEGFSDDLLSELLEKDIGQSSMNQRTTNQSTIIQSTSGQEASRKILATIVARDGSAPRDAGTKMLIRENGTLVGSVGGGWMEAEVIALAKKMFEENTTDAIYETKEDSENASLCGGTEVIYLEMLSC